MAGSSELSPGEESGRWNPVLASFPQRARALIWRVEFSSSSKVRPRGLTAKPSAWRSRDSHSFNPPIERGAPILSSEAELHTQHSQSVNTGYTVVTDSPAHGRRERSIL